jgi:ADP-ribose pyrophosphatase YjhB (NUDIX family)
MPQTQKTESTMNYCSSCGKQVSKRIPSDDSRERWVCDACGIVHYQNPKIVVGCVPEKDGRILLCKRAIEPRYGYWTIPAGFMELGESQAQGAARETLEEACAEVEIGHLFASVDVVDAGQVHVFFTAKLLGDYAAGEESLDVAMYREDEIPWDDIAFHSGRYALQQYFADKGQNNGVHMHELRRANS